MKIAGISIASGAIHLAFVDNARDEDLVATQTSAPVKIEPNANLQEVPRIVDLKLRVTSELRAAETARVVLVETRKLSSWSYKQAYKRVLSIAAVMFAANDLQIPFTTEKTGEIGKLLHVPAKELETLDHSLFGHETSPVYWTTGMAHAFAGAAFGLRKFGD